MRWQAAQATVAQLTTKLEAKASECKQLAAKLHDHRQDQEAPEAHVGARGDAVQLYGLSGPDGESGFEG